jgi:hypothetical protein
MQLFVDGLAAQASRHRVALELVLVEWNPPADRLSLREALRWSAGDGFFEPRVVTVPPALHTRFDPGGALPLFQMLAKNAGIRRSRGRFVLATNVDLLFPDALFRTLRDDLREGLLYRNDRLDVSREVPEQASFEDLMQFCRTHVVRRHRAGGTYVLIHGRWVRTDPPAPPTSGALVRRWLGRWGNAPVAAAAASASSALRGVARLRHGADEGSLPRAARSLDELADRLTAKRRFSRLHRNGAGDFTLLDRETWFRLRGYPEWKVFSWHLDSVLLLQADANRVTFQTLPETQCTYHVDHEGGWTPEDQARLFSRLAQKGIRVLSDQELEALRAGMEDKRRRREPVLFNGEDWGLAGEDLPESRPLENSPSGPAAG